ncbi:hypothetical protein Tco_1497857, partial [Tanacetum coccineum]
TKTNIADDAELVDSDLHSIGDVTLESLNEPADESPYDTTSEIKSKERDADNIIDGMAYLNASAVKPSLYQTPLEATQFVTLLKKISKDLKKKLGVSIHKEVHKGIGTVKRKLDYCTTRVDHNSVKIQDMTTLMRDMIPDSTQGEQDDTVAEKDQSTEQPPKTSEEPPTTKQASQMTTDLVIHSSKIKTSEEISTEDEPPSKRPRTPIVINTPLNQDSIPSKHDDKGKAIATEEDSTKGTHTLLRRKLKMLGLTEWIEVHALASKGKIQSNVYLLKSLKAKFQWVLTQAGRLGIPPPPVLSNLKVSGI